MRDTVMDFPSNKRENQRGLRLDKCLRDATRDYLKRRWPTNTAKMAAREFAGLTLDQARHAANGQPSLATIELIFKRGGLAVALPIVEEVIGQSVARYLIEARASHENQAERFGALLSGRGADPPARHTDPGALDHREAERREFARR